jgi:hypothetical protein
MSDTQETNRNLYDNEMMYTNTSGKKIHYCNLLANNNKEYYVSPKNRGKSFENAIFKPYYIGTISVTALMSIIFGSIALGIRYGGKDKKITGGVIALLVFFFLCLLSMIGSIFYYSTRNNGYERPCYSEKEKKVFEKE